MSTTNSKNFNFKVFEPKQTKNKSIIKQTIRINRKNGEKMTYADVRQYYDTMKNKYGSERISIAGMIEKFNMIKAFDDTDMKPWDDDDYYHDRVKDPEKKFNEFEFVDFIIEN